MECFNDKQLDLANLNSSLKKGDPDMAERAKSLLFKNFTMNMDANLERRYQTQRHMSLHTLPNFSLQQF